MLELKDLSAGYQQHAVIRNIELAFEPGNIHTIIGKNGCGKSTLLKCCSGMISPHSGTILLDGKYLTQIEHTERARLISYLSQSRNTPGITVERLVMHGRFPHLGYPKKLQANDWEQIDRCLHLMQLDAFREKSLADLSGGERQRVYLAMLLAQDTPIVLLDEPTTYMDIEYQLSFLELLSELKRSGKTIVMVLHDLEQALHYSDRIIVMDQGTIVQDGSPNEILEEGTLSKVFHVHMERSPYRFSLKKSLAENPARL